MVVLSHTGWKLVGPTAFLIAWMSTHPVAGQSLAKPKPSSPPAAANIKKSGPVALPELVGLALAANPSTRAAWSRSQAASAAIGQARSAYYPKASARVEAGSDQWYTPAASGPDNFRREQTTVLLSLEYVLMDFGRRSADVDRAVSLFEAADLAFARDGQRVVFAIQRAYFSYITARWRREAAAALVESFRVAAETLEKEARTGLAATPDVDRAKAEVARARYQLESAVADEAKFLGAIRVAAGLPANAELHVADAEPPTALEPILADVDDLVSRAIAMRPDLAERAASVRAAEAATRRARADFFPEVRLEGSYAYSTFGYDARDGRMGGTYQDDRNGYGAFAVATWDIFDGFERVERERRSRAESEAAKQDLASAQLDASAQVWDAFQDHRSAASRVRYAQSLMTSAQQSFDAVQAAARSGLAPLAEFSAAAADLAMARWTLAQSVGDYWISLAALRFALGSASPFAGSPSVSPSGK